MRKLIFGSLFLSLTACQSLPPKNVATNRTMASVSIVGVKFPKCRIDGDKELYFHGEFVKAVSIIDEKTLLLDLDFSSKKGIRFLGGEGQLIAMRSAPSGENPLFKGSNALWSPYLQNLASEKMDDLGHPHCRKDISASIETYLYVDALSESEIRFRVAPLNITTGGDGCSGIAGFGAVAAPMVCSR